MKPGRQRVKQALINYAVAKHAKIKKRPPVTLENTKPLTEAELKQAPFWFQQMLEAVAIAKPHGISTFRESTSNIAAFEIAFAIRKGNYQYLADMLQRGEEPRYAIARAGRLGLLQPWQLIDGYSYCMYHHTYRQPIAIHRFFNDAQDDWSEAAKTSFVPLLRAQIANYDSRKKSIFKLFKAELNQTSQQHFFTARAEPRMLACVLQFYINELALYIKLYQPVIIMLQRFGKISDNIKQNMFLESLLISCPILEQLEKEFPDITLISKLINQYNQSLALEDPNNTIYLFGQLLTTLQKLKNQIGVLNPLESTHVTALTASVFLCMPMPSLDRQAVVHVKLPTKALYAIFQAIGGKKENWSHHQPGMSTMDVNPFLATGTWARMVQVSHPGIEPGITMPIITHDQLSNDVIHMDHDRLFHALVTSFIPIAHRELFIRLGLFLKKYQSTELIEAINLLVDMEFSWYGYFRVDGSSLPSRPEYQSFARAISSSVNQIHQGNSAVRFDQKLPLSMPLAIMLIWLKINWIFLQDSAFIWDNIVKCCVNSEDAQKISRFITAMGFDQLEAQAANEKFAAFIAVKIAAKCRDSDFLMTPKNPDAAKPEKTPDTFGGLKLGFLNPSTSRVTTSREEVPHSSQDVAPSIRSRS